MYLISLEIVEKEIGLKKRKLSCMHRENFYILFTFPNVEMI